MPTATEGRRRLRHAGLSRKESPGDGEQSPFALVDPDYGLSPHTGMTRRHWLDAARMMTDGVFRHIADINAPIALPKQSSVTYPQANDPEWRFKAAEFEGLARTLLAAGPVMAADPEVESNGLRLRDYYANQILLATDPTSPRYLGRISDFTRVSGRVQHQHTVEGAALVIGLASTKPLVWDRYTDAQRDQVAALISDYAHALSIGHNWRFFNVLMLTFLKANGYSIDDAALEDHLQHLLSNYVGDGWYIDDTNYDLYNPWGFHYYGPLWCDWFGREHMPAVAEIIEKRNREFVRTWPRFFSRRGKQLMWGRSIIYRFAASAAFGAHFLFDDPVIDPGFARRIASGNLLQFLSRPGVMVNGLPCLGYYGPFEPLIQFYSCAASPFWMAKCFVALGLPEDSPFWTTRENESYWPELGAASASTELEGPGLQVVNHGARGTTELKPAKVLLNETYYNQLQLNPDFPLEAPSPEGANAANYTVREHDAGHDFRMPLSIAFNKFEDGVLYRVQNTKPKGGSDPHKGGVNRGPECIDLADIVLPGGVLRIDRVRIPYRYELHLGHYALPHRYGGHAAVERHGKSCTASIGDGRKVAMTPIHGWDRIRTATHQGLHPEADASTVLYAERVREKDYSGMEVFATVMLHRIDGGDWTEDELEPVDSFEVLPWSPTGVACGVRVRLKDGREYLIDYGRVDGRRIV